MNCIYTKIAVKIGSNVLTRRDGTLDITRMSALVDQIAVLHRQGIQVVLVSSGAVASGRSELRINRKLDDVDRRQLFSAVGQAKLINHYYDLFREHRIVVGQVLTTKEDFATRRSYLNQKNCMEVMLNNGVIPIVNENDTVSVSELMFTDNDELSGMIASMLGVEALIILSNVDGIYDGPPTGVHSHLITTVQQGKDLSDYIQTEKSGFGRGGMLTKASISHKVAEEGISVFIANGRTDDILVKLINDSEHTLCTHFLPSAQEVSSIKKWIAHSEGFAKGYIRLNADASATVKGKKAVSILFVGITAIEGEFEKDDLVTIEDARGHDIGLGKAAFDSAEARSLIGQHGHKPMIHYDYMYIE
jgi:glutamate 5-kinase